MYSIERVVCDEKDRKSSIVMDRIGRVAYCDGYDRKSSIVMDRIERVV